MKKCKFNYRPTFIYLYSCESIEDLKAQKFEYFGESDYNSTGTIEYNITVRKKVIFKYRIPVNHIEEEDLKIDELEGKILIREINVYSHQSIDAFMMKRKQILSPVQFILDWHIILMALPLMMRKMSSKTMNLKSMCQEMEK